MSTFWNYLFPSRSKRRKEKRLAGEYIVAGDAANAQRRWREAAEAYRQALALDDRLQPIWVQYGHALKEQGGVEESVAAYRRAVELKPDDPDAHLQFGHALKLLDRLEEAGQAYAEALRLDPGMTAAADEIEAVETLERKRRQIGECIVAGDAANAQRRWREAAEAYREALGLDDGLQPIWVQYGHALKEQGGVEESVAAYRRAVELKPDDPDAHLQLGHALKLLGRPGEARQAYAEALRLDPGMTAAADEIEALAGISVLNGSEAGKHGPAPSVPGEDVETIRRSHLFDADWYLERYPDVGMLGMDPAKHYLWLGAKLGRNPSPNFDSAAYLDIHKDVDAAAFNPLLHYLREGLQEGRRTVAPSEPPRSPG